MPNAPDTNDAKLADALHNTFLSTLKDEGCKINSDREPDADKGNVWQLDFKLGGTNYAAIFDRDDGEYVRIAIPLASSMFSNFDDTVILLACNKTTGTVKCAKAEANRDDDTDTLVPLITIETLIYSPDHLSFTMIERYASILLGAAKQVLEFCRESS